MLSSEGLKLPSIVCGTQVRLALARKAAKAIQGLARAHHESKRGAAAAGFQSLWRRYAAR